MKPWIKPSARHAKRAEVSVGRRNANREKLEAKCNACGQVVIRLSARLVRASDPYSVRQLQEAFRRHAQKTGCEMIANPVQTLADAPSEQLSTLGMEYLCSGCGLIIHTATALEARDNPQGIQAETSKLLMEHHKATGCPCERNPDNPRPKRRDGRCAPPEHFAGCRCDMALSTIETDILQ